MIDDTAAMDSAPSAVNNAPDASAPSLSDLQPSKVTLVAGDRPGINILNQWATAMRAEKVAQARSQVVQQAIKQYKSGDTKGAFATMGMLHEDQFAKTVSAEATAEPSSYGKTEGQLKAQSEFQSTPGQIENTKAAAQVQAAGAKADKPVVRKDDNSPTGFSLVTPKGVVPFDAYAVDQKRPAPQAPAAAGVQAPAPTSLRPNEIWDPEANKKVLLAPVQQKALSGGIKDFNKETAKMVEGINSGHAAVQAIENNAPGADIIEKMRLIRQFSPRPAVQEVMGVGKGQGWETWLNTEISKAEGRGMGPQERANMLRIAKVFQSSGLEEYNSLLHNRVSQISEAAHISEGAVQSRLGDNLPTPIQSAIQNLQKNGNEQDHAAVDAAQEILKRGNVKDPNYEKAKAVLKRWGLM